MENTKYEILYIIRPNIDEEAKSALIARFDTILTDNGAEVIESKDWQKRRLAYEMDGFREGISLKFLLHQMQVQSMNLTVLLKSMTILSVT